MDPTTIGLIVSAVTAVLVALLHYRQGSAPKTPNTPSAPFLPAPTPEDKHPLLDAILASSRLSDTEKVALRALLDQLPARKAA